jgi:hypothetical protein
MFISTLYRPVRLVAEVFFARVASSRQHGTEAQDAVRFGFPLIQPDRWLEDFKQVGFREEVQPLILKQNAIGLLGLQKES